MSNNAQEAAPAYPETESSSEGNDAIEVQEQQPEEFHGDDDPQCLYVLACLGFFIPLIGFIGMCCYQCGQNLGPKQTQAFKIMAGCTIVGFIIGLLIMVSS